MKELLSKFIIMNEITKPNEKKENMIIVDLKIL